MQTEYVTEKGHRLSLGRIDRRLIDRLRIEREPPQPPTRAVEVWGGIEEEIPVLDDPGYQAQRMQYHLWLAKQQASVIAEAVTILDEDKVDWTELTELADLGLVIPSPGVGFLTYLLSERDRANVVDLVLYQSTVTDRGIAEAETAFEVTWHRLPVRAWRVPGTPGRVGSLFGDRQAAQFGGYNWSAFCELTGPEQSAVVAFYKISRRLEWLMFNPKM